MKKLAIVACLLLSGCAGVHVKTPQWSVTGFSLFKDIQIPKAEVKIDDKTTIKIQGYGSSTDAEAMGTILGAAMKAAK